MRLRYPFPYPGDNDFDIKEISVHYYTGGSRMAHELLIKRDN